MDITPNNIQAFSSENFYRDIKMHWKIDFESLHIDWDFFQLGKETKFYFREIRKDEAVPMDCC
jgi:hypothetical protein